MLKVQTLIAYTEAAEQSLEGLRLFKQSLQQALQFIETMPSMPGAHSSAARSKIPTIQKELAILDARFIEGSC